MWLLILFIVWAWTQSGDISKLKVVWETLLSIRVSSYLYEYLCVLIFMWLYLSWHDIRIITAVITGSYWLHISYIQWIFFTGYQMFVASWFQLIDYVMRRLHLCRSEDRKRERCEAVVYRLFSPFTRYLLWVGCYWSTIS